MIIFDNYIQNIDNTKFLFKSDEYFKNKKLISYKSPLLKLDKLYILEKYESFDYNLVKNCFVLKINLGKKILIFTYSGIFTTNYDLLNKLIYNFIDTNRIKIIPYLINFKDMFIKSNLPIIIEKHFKLNITRNNNYYEININLDNYFAKNFINKMVKNNGKTFFAFTIDSKKSESVTNEVFIALFGFDNLHNFI